MGRSFSLILTREKGAALRFKVVNLDRSPERLQQFARQNRHLVADRWPAVDGNRIDRDQVVREGYFKPENDYSPGALGCALSHIGLWLQCAAGTEPIHVVEDDMILREDIEQTAPALLASLGDDWDIVLWAHNLNWPLQIKPAPGIGVAALQYQHDLSPNEGFQAARTKPALLPLFSAAGTGCYSVSPSGAARILADCLPIGAVPAVYLEGLDKNWANSGIDVELCRHYTDWRAFVSVPFLAIGDNDQQLSTIRGHLDAMHDPAIANKAVR
jgi:hypothetical protein